MDHMCRESQEISFSMIYGKPGPGTGWSGSVPDFENFVSPGPVPDFENFLGPGPV